MTLTHNSRWGSSVIQFGETHCMALLAGQSSCFLCLLGRLFLISLCNFHVLIDRRLLTMQFSISVVLILWSVQLVNFIFTLKKHAPRGKKANSHLCQISPFTKILGFCYLRKIMLFQHYGWGKKACGQNFCISRQVSMGWQPNTDSPKSSETELCQHTLWQYFALMYL